MRWQLSWSVGNDESYLKRVLKAAWYGHISTHNLHALNSGQLDATFQQRLFLQQNSLDYSKQPRVCIPETALQINRTYCTYPRTTFRILQVLGIQHKKSLFIVTGWHSLLLLRFFDQSSLQNHPGEHFTSYEKHNEKYCLVLSYQERRHCLQHAETE